MMRSWIWSLICLTSGHLDSVFTGFERRPGSVHHPGIFSCPSAGSPCLLKQFTTQHTKAKGTVGQEIMSCMRLIPAGTQVQLALVSRRRQTLFRSLPSKESTLAGLAPEYMQRFHTKPQLQEPFNFRHRHLNLATAFENLNIGLDPIL